MANKLMTNIWKNVNNEMKIFFVIQNPQCTFSVCPPQDLKTKARPSV